MRDAGERNAFAAVNDNDDRSLKRADVWIETGAGQPLPDGHELSAGRREVDQFVLANLLRMNLARPTEA